jgi:hypothetical protein
MPTRVRSSLLQQSNNIRRFQSNTAGIVCEYLDAQVGVALLKERAPNAVQVYLEHLVFTKNVSLLVALVHVE